MVVERLEGFSRVLVADGYEAYVTAVKVLMRQWLGLCLCGCWSYARRKFDEAQGLGLARQGGKVQQVLASIGKFYAIERAVPRTSITTSASEAAPTRRSPHP